MSNEGHGCKICHTTRKQLICPNCVRSLVLHEQILQRLKAAQDRRAELEKQLNDALKSQEGAVVQQEQLKERQVAVARAKARCQRAEEEARRGQAKAQELRHKHVRWKADVESALEKLGQDGRDTRERVLAEERQQSMLQLHFLRDTLRSDTRKHVRTLLEMLPVSLSATQVTQGRWTARAEGAGGTSSPGVSICGLQLPNSLAIPSGASTQRLGTSLGNVTLLVDMLAALLGAPLLHTLRFKGSTSELWAPKSFWDESAPSEAAVYRLYRSQALAHPSNANGSAATTAGALSSLKQHWPWDRGAPSAQAQSSTVSLRQERENLAAAVHQLSRSIGALLSDQLYLFPIRVPHEWSPFAALAGLCMQLATEPRADGRRSLSASLAAPALLRGAESHAFFDAFLLDNEEEDEVTDGWDLVQRPTGYGAGSVMRPHQLLPPPPSEDDAVRHWERAMITDSTAQNRVRNLMPTPLSFGQHIAPLGPAAFAAADRLWTGLWRGSQ